MNNIVSSKHIWCWFDQKLDRNRILETQMNPMCIAGYYGDLTK